MGLDSDLGDPRLPNTVNATPFQASFDILFLGSLDLLDTLNTATEEKDRESWRNDVWDYMLVRLFPLFPAFSYP